MRYRQLEAIHFEAWMPCGMEFPLKQIEQSPHRRPRVHQRLLERNYPVGEWCLLHTRYSMRMTEIFFVVVNYLRSSMVKVTQICLG